MACVTMAMSSEFVPQTRSLRHPPSAPQPSVIAALVSGSCSDCCSLSVFTCKGCDNVNTSIGESGSSSCCCCCSDGVGCSTDK